ncbi:propionate--CoA ligase [Acidovorax sp. NCPPB 4044]|uniref:propionate--CoA ligase n=1 Tax=Acidovorax sp. NCPPB 4044 TaxID=2940490 RepID=UPI00230253A7|nr:propionate--CoA ligase [Acidovorax sp. NCPPB 4044]MDA8520508.1 propionate--CoA ligase [Acidovorax sp. NCPPB 4044]
MSYAEFYQRSVEQPDAFWREQAELIDWIQPFSQVHDGSNAPFEQWFTGGKLNLCHNAVDRHALNRPDDKSLVWCSTEVDREVVFTFKELLREVQAMAASLLSLGVRKGDRVLVYMPMIPEAVFSMLACARIGAVHSVVFGGFSSVSLATRIDDAQPTIIVSADAGSRAGKVIPYKPLLDEAIRLANYKPAHVLMVDRHLADWDSVSERDVDYGPLRMAQLDRPVPCVPLDSTDTSYTLYTSGTTGKPKGVQRDVGGYAVALAASMKHVFLAEAGKTFFATSDVGWVVGHSYIVYGPLIAGMATIVYEGTPLRPNPSIWWRLVEKYQVTTMFSAPTAIRILKKEGPTASASHDLGSLRALFLAGEPLDETTSAWIAQALRIPVIDNYWQTESGWPILTLAQGIEPLPAKLGSTGLPVYGYRVRIVDEITGETLTEPHRKGLIALEGPLPPGFMQTVWRDDGRFLKTYWQSVPGKRLYSTFDWGYRDEDGYYFIVGRTDDVINVAGHRLGTGEIEASIATNERVAEVAVVGVKDGIKGQVAVAFVTRKQNSSDDDSDTLERMICKTVEQQIGAVARPARIHFVEMLPKTRSGKLLRRALQAVAEGRDPGDLSTMEDPGALRQIEQQLRQG